MPTGAIAPGGSLPPTAAWMGSPGIKGSSESARMAYLTAALVGIQ